MYQAGANGLRDCSAEDESRDEVPKCSPDNGAKWRENTGRDHGCDRIGGVVPAVGKFEGERQDNNGHKEMEGTHGSGALQDDAFNDVGNIFTFIDGSLDNLEDLLPLDDLNGILFFIKQ